MNPTFLMLGKISTVPNKQYAESAGMIFPIIYRDTFRKKAYG
jgi:hypothetical protein